MDGKWIQKLETVKNSPTEIFLDINDLKVPGKFQENKLLLIIF